MTSDYTPHNDITGDFDENAADAPKADFHDSANGSLMDNLKSAGEAWLMAGSALGNVASHFAEKFREDRESATPQGAHALGDVTDSHDSLGKQLKAAIDHARESFNSADNDKDFRAAASTFASDAEGIFRDLTGSLSRAGDATMKSGQTEDAKAAFSDALGEVRETFNQAVAGVRNRADESDIDAEGTVNDLRSRLDGLINKVSDQFDKGADKTGKGGSTIVDGEVVEDDK